MNIQLTKVIYFILYRFITYRILIMDIEQEWSEEDSEDEEEEESIENNPNNRKIIVCELYNDHIHGENYANGHFLVFRIFPNISDRKIARSCSTISRWNQELFDENAPRLPPHKTIRNYIHITETNVFSSPQIATCSILPTGELVAVLKTVYLRIFQRIWKKYYKKLMENVKKRMTLDHINASRLSWPIRFR